MWRNKTPSGTIAARRFELLLVRAHAEWWLRRMPKLPIEIRRRTSATHEAALPLASLRQERGHALTECDKSRILTSFDRRVAGSSARRLIRAQQGATIDGRYHGRMGSAK
jgi:hypothetical protein